MYQKIAISKCHFFCNIMQETTVLETFRKNMDNQNRRLYINMSFNYNYGTFSESSISADPSRFTGINFTQ